MKDLKNPCTCTSPDTEVKCPSCVEAGASEETFEEWLHIMRPIDNDSWCSKQTRNFSMAAWNHQQKKITKRDEIIKELEEALGFYAYEADVFEGYSLLGDYSTVWDGDLGVGVLGKRARAALAKIRGVRGET